MGIAPTADVHRDVLRWRRKQKGAVNRCRMRLVGARVIVIRSSNVAVVRVNLSSGQAWNIGEVDAGPILGQEVDANDRKIMRCSAFLFGVPADLESQFAPAILRKISEVESGSRPSVLVRDNVLPDAGLFLKGLIDTVPRRRKDLSDIGHRGTRITGWKSSREVCLHACAGTQALIVLIVIRAGAGISQFDLCRFSCNAAALALTLFADGPNSPLRPPEIGPCGSAQRDSWLPSSP